MTWRAHDLEGQTFGRLTVVARAGTEHGGSSRWLCRCVCGTEIKTRAGNLVRGNTKSCGCLNAEVAAAKMRVVNARRGLGR